MRGWLLRRNYRQMRGASRTLQAHTRGMLARREYKQMRRHAAAALVIQRSMLGWLKGPKLPSVLESPLEYEPQGAGPADGGPPAPPPEPVPWPAL